MRKIETRKAWAWEENGRLRDSTFNTQGTGGDDNLQSIPVRFMRERDFLYILSLARQAESIAASAKSFADELPRKKGRK